MRPSIDIAREARRRIPIAAAKRGQSNRDYVWEAIEARLKEDQADESATGDLIAVSECTDPVLSELLDNPKDAAYDALQSRRYSLGQSPLCRRDGQHQASTPTMIVSTDQYHRVRREAVLVEIASNTGRLLAGDYMIKTWRESGLLYPSIVTHIVRLGASPETMDKEAPLSPMGSDQ